MPSVIAQSTTPVLQAGKLRHKVKILQPTLAQDAAGGTNVADEVVVATVRASIEALVATEKFATQEFITQSRYRVIIRWRSGITSKMRIQFKRRLFLIEGVSNPDERNKMLVLQCLEISDSAQVKL